MEQKTTISVEKQTKDLVAQAKEYKGQTYDELLRNVFSELSENE